jgi:uncharacterized protein YacL
MEKIKTYKAISNKELLYGYQALDLAFVLMVSFAVIFYVSMILGILIFIVLAIFFKKFAKRRENYFKNLITYTFTPKIFSVRKETKIKPYKDVLDGTDKT